MGKRHVKVSCYVKVYDLEEPFHFAKQLVKKILKYEDILHI